MSCESSPNQYLVTQSFVVAGHVGDSGRAGEKQGPEVQLKLSKEVKVTGPVKCYRLIEFLYYSNYLIPDHCNR